MTRRNADLILREIFKFAAIFCCYIDARLKGDSVQEAEEKARNLSRTLK